MNADHAGRVDCNFNDIKMALLELNVSIPDLNDFMESTPEMTLEIGINTTPFS